MPENKSSDKPGCLFYIGDKLVELLVAIIGAGAGAYFGVMGALSIQNHNENRPLKSGVVVDRESNQLAMELNNPSTLKVRITSARFIIRSHNRTEPVMGAIPVVNVEFTSKDYEATGQHGSYAKTLSDVEIDANSNLNIVFKVVDQRFKGQVLKGDLLLYFGDREREQFIGYGDYTIRVP